MPTGPRIRANNVFGFVSDNPLLIGASTFNSPGLAQLPVVSGAHAFVTLDPMRQFGEPEIVEITNHSSSATVATINRGALGTAAREHPQGTLWVHAPVNDADTNTFSDFPGDPIIRTYTANDTWNKPNGLRYVRVWVVGGGGAAGGASTTAAGQTSMGAGGGGGETRVGILLARDLGASETVTIGAGGTGVVGATGNGGASSSFGAHISADGGGGSGLLVAGSSVAAFGGNGGGRNGTGGQFSFPGLPGGYAFRESGTGQGGHAGPGGNSHLGHGGGIAVNGNGGTGSTFGGGGGGGQNSASQGTARAGGNGGAGVVIVEEYY